jgi:hypothetical protein
MRRLIIAGVAAVLVAGTAYASSCPKEMTAIDAALKTTNLDAAKKKQVMDLRAKGETEHKAGKHADSLKALGEAKQLLGIK